MNVDKKISKKVNAGKRAHPRNKSVLAALLRRYATQIENGVEPEVMAKRLRDLADAIAAKITMGSLS